MQDHPDREKTMSDPTRGFSVLLWYRDYVLSIGHHLNLSSV
jgi:hypothetical protein